MYFYLFFNLKLAVYIEQYDVSLGIVSTLMIYNSVSFLGIKRLALRNFLQNKIEQNKIIAFERAKKLAKIDDEEDLDNIETHFESESDEDTIEDEEPIVSFDKENEIDKNDFNTESHELSNNEDSDDDGFRQRKVKKIHILEDESAEESDLDSDCQNVDVPTESRFQGKRYEYAQINENMVN